MRITWTAGSILSLAGIVLLAIFGVWIWTQRERLAGGVKQAANLVNPASSQNLANRAVTETVTTITGRQETLGGWLAEIFSGTTREANRQLEESRVLNPIPRGTGYDSSGGPAYG
jgi:hypothetical protein